MSATRVPVTPSIAARHRAPDITVSLTFSPTDPAALVEVHVEPDPGPRDHDVYLGALGQAAARLMLYARDYRAVVQAGPGQPDEQDGGLPSIATRRPRRLADGHGHEERRRRQAHAYRPLPWTGQHAHRCP